MTDIEKIKDSFRAMDNLLREAEEEFAEMKKFEQQLKKLSKKIKTLENFYHSDEWMKGREIIYKDKKNTELFYSAGEDSIYDLSQDFFYQKIQLIQQLSKNLK